MDASQHRFYQRMNASGHGSNANTPLAGPSKNKQFVRNQHLSAMLERHDALIGQAKRTQFRRDPVAAIAPYLSVVLAFAMGGLAAIIALFVRFQLAGEVTSPLSPDVELTLDIVFAIAIAFMLREVVSLSAVKRMGAQFAGILLAIVTMHNVVHAMPEPFERLFSPAWVSNVQATTDAGTLQFRGHSYHL
ncbi:hypothetical protein [Celeribacter marinus]|uniref:hypothetical protein n=1 Tax=Celeribacter marinus TaxID=1397108 RepID=UPI00317E5EA8